VIFRRKLLRDQRHRVDQAARMPARQASEQVAVALRTVLAEIPRAPRDEIESLVGECESLAFAPDTGSVETLDGELIARARAFLDRSSKELE
jgi:hypothetical protein